MPVLKGKVAAEMGIEEEQLKTDEAKAAMMATFQEFLSNDDGSDSDEIIDEEPAKKKPKKMELKSKLKENVELKEKTTTKTKTKEETKSIEAEDSLAKKSPKNKTASDGLIERLKSYIFKCGVRKVW